MLILKWSNSSLFAVSDHDSVKYAESIIEGYLDPSFKKDEDYIVDVSNDMIVTAMRLKVAKGEFDYSDVVFRDGEIDYKIDTYGKFNPEFPSCLDIQMKLNMELIGTAVKRRREER